MNRDEAIHIRTRDGAVERCFSYRVAMCTVYSDRPLAPAVIRGTEALAPPGPLAAFDDSELRDPPWRQRGRYLIGGQQRMVCCAVSGPRSQIDIAGIGRLNIRDGGRSIVFSSDSSTAGKPATVPLIDNAIIGPGLLSSLAHRGIFALHGSSLCSPSSGSVLLIGASGAGKSTLAAAGGRDRQRLADDVQPVALDAEGPVLLPHYPQFSLQRDQQYPSTSPDCIPLSRIFVLDPGVADDERRVRASTMATRNATMALIRHTIASPIFPPRILADHLEFCGRLAAMVPVYRLRYPQAREFIPEILETIQGPD